jgi:uncharacterized protein YukE
VDFVALADLADLLRGYQEKDQAIISSVNKSIQSIARDAGWTGDAAKTFANAWEKDTQLAGKLGGFEADVADVIAELAIALSWIQKKLVERVDELARTVGLANFGGSAVAADAALREEQAKASKQANEQAQKAQKAAADKLKDLYTGKTGGWSAIEALDDLKHNQYVPRDLKDTISKLEDGLKDQLPGQKSLFEKVMDSKTVEGITSGGGVGTVVGGLIGTIGGPPGMATGAAIGGTLGGTGGGIWGGIEDLW